MKDAIGQEIFVGATVLHSNGNYCGFTKSTVERLTPKKVKLPIGGAVYPDTIVVIDINLHCLKEGSVLTKPI